MNVDLFSMHKGPEAAAKWQLLPPLIQELSRFEFMSSICDGTQEWELTDVRIKRLEDGRRFWTAQISMKIGEFAFAFFPRTGKSILIDFHIYAQDFEEFSSDEYSLN